MKKPQATRRVSSCSTVVVAYKAAGMSATGLRAALRQYWFTSPSAKQWDIKAVDALADTLAGSQTSPG